MYVTMNIDIHVYIERHNEYLLWPFESRSTILSHLTGQQIIIEMIKPGKGS